MLNFENPCDPSHIRALHESLLDAEKAGNKEIAETFRDLIKETEQVCHVVKRNMATQSNTATLKLPQSFRGMLDVVFPEPVEKEPQSPAQGAMSGFQRMLEASEHGGAQNTVQSAIVSRKEKAVTRNFGGGFRGMFDSAFAEGEERELATDQDETDAAFWRGKIKEMETRILNRVSGLMRGKERMLHKDDPYISSKPAKGIFDKIYKPRMETPRTKAEKKFTRRGFTRYEIINNPDGTMSLKLPDPPPEQPRSADPIPQCLVELAYHDRERQKERIRRSAHARRTTTQCRFGLKAMINEAFR